MKRQKIRKLLLLISFLLFPVTLFYLSPVLIIQGSFAGVAGGSLLFFGALFLFSLVFGRAFCGWLCPAGGLQDCCRLVVDKKVGGKRVNMVKYMIWVPWLLVIAIGFVFAGGIRKLDFFYMTDHGISVSGPEAYAAYLIVLSLLLMLALSLGRRGACHAVCWMAPFMVIGTKLKDQLGYPSLRLSADSAKCVDCGVCTKNCPMSLPVAAMVRQNRLRNSECILCGACVDGCKKGALDLGFQKGKELSLITRQARR